jgi:hypothetical protein
MEGQRRAARCFPGGGEIVMRDASVGYCCAVMFSWRFRCQIAGEFGFDFFNGRDTAAQSILGDEFVLFPAKEQAYGGLVVGMAQEVVHGGKVKIQLTDIARREGAGFHLDDDIAAELEVVEEEVER